MAIRENCEILAYENKLTKDKRLLRPDSVTWDTPCPVIDGDSRERIGWITSIERIDDTIWATIDFDLPNDMVLSMSGADADYQWIEDTEQIEFDHIRVAGAMLLFKDTWAW